ncbi:hypothetical protein OTK49_21160 [Vibrio coralliirubri]|uniref:hypothetical protein n=1 Tax=Vibrio coralliirubri TaxID=1516159 RepID=UPI0022853768|nr:hypothetical protein [Vibrio coralliirubri]MCY9865030.1 hypothetical protein [Vibrio coralliirubri]
MFLKSFLSKSEVRIRITPTIEKAICEFAGTDKFAKALPALEAAVRLTAEIRRDTLGGCQFFEKLSNGEVVKVNFNFDQIEDNTKATERVRITDELQTDIINMAELLGCQSANDDETKFVNARPYILNAINTATLLKEATENGSKFLIKYEDGEKQVIRFM